MTTPLNHSEIHMANATLDDIPAMVGLLTVLFNIELDFHPDTEKQVQGLRLIINSADQAVIKTARVAGKVVGMVSAQLVISTAEGAQSAWIEDMVVAEAYRAHGVGRMLLQEALAWAEAHGATRAQLLVDVDNEGAKGYYTHLGWQTSNMNMRRIFLK